MASNGTGPHYPGSVPVGAGCPCSCPSLAQVPLGNDGSRLPVSLQGMVPGYNGPRVGFPGAAGAMGYPGGVKPDPEAMNGSAGGMVKLEPGMPMAGGPGLGGGLMGGSGMMGAGPAGGGGGISLSAMGGGGGVSLNPSMSLMNAGPLIRGAGHRDYGAGATIPASTAGASEGALPGRAGAGLTRPLPSVSGRIPVQGGQVPIPGMIPNGVKPHVLGQQAPVSHQAPNGAGVAAGAGTAAPTGQARADAAPAAADAAGSGAAVGSDVAGLAGMDLDVGGGAAGGAGGPASGGGSGENKSKQDAVKRHASWLLILKHSLKCQGDCPYGAHCTAARELWVHMRDCKASQARQGSLPLLAPPSPDPCCLLHECRTPSASTPGARSAWSCSSTSPSARTRPAPSASRSARSCRRSGPRRRREWQRQPRARPPGRSRSIPRHSGASSSSTCSGRGRRRRPWPSGARLPRPPRYSLCPDLPDLWCRPPLMLTHACRPWLPRCLGPRCWRHLLPSRSGRTSPPAGWPRRSRSAPMRREPPPGPAPPLPEWRADVSAPLAPAVACRPRVLPAGCRHHLPVLRPGHPQLRAAPPVLHGVQPADQEGAGLLVVRAGAAGGQALPLQPLLQRDQGLHPARPVREGEPRGAVRSQVARPAAPGPAASELLPPLLRSCQRATSSRRSTRRTRTSPGSAATGARPGSTTSAASSTRAATTSRCPSTAPTA